MDNNPEFTEVGQMAHRKYICMQEINEHSKLKTGGVPVVAQQKQI